MSAPSRKPHNCVQSLPHNANNMLTFQSVKLFTLISLYMILFVLELTANQVTHSLTILIDGYHNLYTAMSLLLLFISYKVSFDQTLKNTFGWARIEVLGSLFNVIFFVALCFSVVVEGLQFLAHLHEHKEPAYTELLIVSGACGFALHILLYFIISDEKIINEAGFVNIHGTDVHINFVASRECVTRQRNGEDVQQDLMQKDGTDQQPIPRSEHRVGHCEALRVHSVLKCRSPFAHLIRDFSTSIMLMLTYLIIFWANNVLTKTADSILGILGVFVLLATLLPTMKQAGMILLQTVPNSVDLTQLKKMLKKEFPFIIDIHDLHIWSLTPDQIIATCHVVLPWQTTTVYMQFTSKLESFFATQGINLVSVQPEFKCDGSNEKRQKCLYICKSDCGDKSCCNEKDETPLEILSTQPLLRD